MDRSSFQAACRFAVGVAILALALHTWLMLGLVVPVSIAGSSMEPTLIDARRLLVDRTAFTLRQPRRWEVVVFQSPDDPTQLCVKRVVGLPGETVLLDRRGLVIDGVTTCPPGDFGYAFRYGDRVELQTGVQLGPTEFFVLGDNAAISDDSRNWASGPALDANLLIGRPIGVR